MAGFGKQQGHQQDALSWNTPLWFAVSSLSCVVHLIPLDIVLAARARIVPAYRDAGAQAAESMAVSGGLLPWWLRAQFFNLSRACPVTPQGLRLKIQVGLRK